MELHTVEKDIAAAIKKHFDEKYKPIWHCIVGKNFGKPVSFLDAWATLCRVETLLLVVGPREGGEGSVVCQVRM